MMPKYLQQALHVPSAVPTKEVSNLHVYCGSSASKCTYVGMGSDLTTWQLVREGRHGNFLYGASRHLKSTGGKADQASLMVLAVELGAGRDHTVGD